jgi:hypothetical protein
MWSAEGRQSIGTIANDDATSAEAWSAAKVFNQGRNEDRTLCTGSCAAKALGGSAPSECRGRQNDTVDALRNPGAGRNVAVYLANAESKRALHCPD